MTRRIVYGLLVSALLFASAGAQSISNRSILDEDNLWGAFGPGAYIWIADGQNPVEVTFPDVSYRRKIVPFKVEWRRENGLVSLRNAKFLSNKLCFQSTVNQRWQCFRMAELNTSSYQAGLQSYLTIVDERQNVAVGKVGLGVFRLSDNGVCGRSNLQGCNDDELCSRATGRTSSGVLIWQTGIASPFVTEAKRRSLNCGVDDMTSPQPNYGDASCQLANLEACNEQTVCQRATTGMPLQWRTNGVWARYARLAQERGLSCGVVGATETFENSRNRPDGICSFTNLRGCSDDQVCERGTVGVPKQWRQDDDWRSAYTVEAKRRELTCGVSESDSDDGITLVVKRFEDEQQPASETTVDVRNVEDVRPTESANVTDQPVVEEAISAEIETKLLTGVDEFIGSTVIVTDDASNTFVFQPDPSGTLTFISGTETVASTYHIDELFCHDFSTLKTECWLLKKEDERWLLTKPSVLSQLGRINVLTNSVSNFDIERRADFTSNLHQQMVYSTQEQGLIVISPSDKVTFEYIYDGQTAAGAFHSITVLCSPIFQTSLQSECVTGLKSTDTFSLIGISDFVDQGTVTMLGSRLALQESENAELPIESSSDQVTSDGAEIETDAKSATDSSSQDKEVSPLRRKRFLDMATAWSTENAHFSARGFSWSNPYIGILNLVSSLDTNTSQKWRNEFSRADTTNERYDALVASCRLGEMIVDCANYTDEELLSLFDRIENNHESFLLESAYREFLAQANGTRDDHEYWAAVFGIWWHGLYGEGVHLVLGGKLWEADNSPEYLEALDQFCADHTSFDIVFFMGSNNPRLCAPTAENEVAKLVFDIDRPFIAFGCSLLNNCQIAEDRGWELLSNLRNLQNAKRPTEGRLGQYEKCRVLENEESLCLVDNSIIHFAPSK